MSYLRDQNFQKVFNLLVSSKTDTNEYKYFTLIFCKELFFVSVRFHNLKIARFCPDGKSEESNLKSSLEQMTALRREQSMPLGTLRVLLPPSISDS